MSPIFNSQNLSHKQPFGAIKTEENVTFTLHIPTAYGCETPYMFLIRDGGDTRQLPLYKEGEQDDRTLFSLTTSIPEAGLYFYYFDLWKDYRKLFRGEGGASFETTEQGPLYQLTVYNKDYTTPSAAYGAVMYQIFPDRFYEGDPDKPLSYNERIYRHDKSKEPYFWPDNQENGYLTRDFFGGDLVGIQKKLPYLKSLGIDWIYLTPITESHSNHRYDTADYLKVDPTLGTNEDFAALCKAAKEQGMYIMLDGVFSHTGADSVYFNRYGRYPSYGAYQGADSPYRSWYHFHNDGSYDSWWGFETLPACNKQNPDFRHFICGEGGVIDHWLSLGASGFRLDVADELPDDFIAEIRTAIKRNGDDKWLIGEVWEDATNKEAYHVRRQYFMGRELDGVMNYPFRTAILRFFRDFNAPAFRESIMSVVENYPAPAMAACTTHIATHDTERAITSLADEPTGQHDRFWQSGRRLSAEKYQHGIMLLQLATVLQFTLPGVPSVYYGDEIAMQGYKDPFNRAFFDWNSKEDRLRPLITQLSQLRHSCSAFKEGSLVFRLAKDGVLSYERQDNTSVAAIAVNATYDFVFVDMLGEQVELAPMSSQWRTKNI